jgi:hypothetical protein
VTSAPCRRPSPRRGPVRLVRRRSSATVAGCARPRSGSACRGTARTTPPGRVAGSRRVAAPPSDRRATRRQHGVVERVTAASRAPSASREALTAVTNDCTAAVRAHGGVPARARSPRRRATRPGSLGVQVVRRPSARVGGRWRSRRSAIHGRYASPPALGGAIASSASASGGLRRGAGPPGHDSPDEKKRLG